MFKMYKKIWEIYQKDIEKDGLTGKEYTVFAIAAPISLVLLMGFAGWLETVMF